MNFHFVDRKRSFLLAPWPRTEAGNALNFSGLRQKGQGYSALILAIQPCDAKLVFTI